MSYRPKGKHVLIDSDNPEALGICDKTQFVFKRKDLIKQMEWRGNALVWTGFLVGRPYVDTPNEQLRPPILPPDPVPTVQPRLQQSTTLTWNVGSVGLWGSFTIPTWDSWGSIQDGNLGLEWPGVLSQLQNTYFGA